MNKERIATVFLIVLTNTIGATVILPMMALYVEKQFGATPLQATLILAAFYVAQIWAAALAKAAICAVRLLRGCYGGRIAMEAKTLWGRVSL